MIKSNLRRWSKGKTPFYDKVIFWKTKSEEDDEEEVKAKG